MFDQIIDYDAVEAVMPQYETDGERGQWLGIYLGLLAQGASEADAQAGAIAEVERTAAFVRREKVEAGKLPVAALKHLPGEHDQLRHAPHEGGAALSDVVATTTHNVLGLKNAGEFAQWRKRTVSEGLASDVVAVVYNLRTHKFLFSTFADHMAALREMYPEHSKEHIEARGKYLDESVRFRMFFDAA